MDTLSWTRLVPTLEIKETKKKFYGTYLYKVVVKVPCARLILNDSKLPISKQLENITQYISKLSFDRWAYKSDDNGWKSSRMHGVNESQLEYYKKISEQHKNSIKIRVEEPNLSIYSNDESLLYQLVKDDKSSIVELHRPISARAAEILEQGDILVKKNGEYDFKVIFRETSAFSVEARQQVFQYLTGLENTVKLTNGCKKNLMNRSRWFTQTYFYTNDISILTFLNLIAPGAVIGFYKLTKLDQ